MPIFWTRRTDAVQDAMRVSWPTREPRPRLWDDGQPTTATMIRNLPKVTR